MRDISNFQLLRWFVIEEYRFLTSLFGSYRVYLFPIMILLFGVIIGLIAPILDVVSTVSITGYLAIILFFGIQTGLVGFEARDMIKNVVGEDISRIIFSSRTLPVSQKKLATIFLIKDGLFYSFIIIAPLIIGLFLGSLGTSMIGSVTSTVTILGIVKLFVVSNISFFFGVSVGFFFTTVASGNTLIKIVFGILTGSLTIFFLLIGIDTIISGIQSNIILSSVLAIFVTIILSVVGILNFTVSEKTYTESNYLNLYGRISEIFNRDNIGKRAIIIKTIVDIQRSSGGVWKLILSTIVILGVIYASIITSANVLNFRISEPFLYGSLLSLIAYPVYTVLFRYDNYGSYNIYPLSKSEVIEAKTDLFLIISAVIGFIYYSIVTLPNVNSIIYTTGLMIFFGLLVFQIGFLTRIVKDEPTRFLFDGLRFSLYAFVSMIFIMPSVMVGLYSSLLPEYMFAVSISSVLIATLIGTLLTYFNKKN